MQTLGDPREHFWRVIKMAKACEVDLSTALDTGQIDIDGYADMITACRGCTQVEKCDRLLETLPTRESAPSYCENKELFGELKSGPA
ncbi:MAG: DUF6455 family protein [Pseudomonadota bacterium]